MNVEHKIISWCTVDESHQVLVEADGVEAANFTYYAWCSVNADHQVETEVHQLPAER